MFVVSKKEVSKEGSFNVVLTVRLLSTISFTTRLLWAVDYLFSPPAVSSVLVVSIMNGVGLAKHSWCMLVLIRHLVRDPGSQGPRVSEFLVSGPVKLNRSSSLCDAEKRPVQRRCAYIVKLCPPPRGVTHLFHCSPGCATWSRP
ncbi:hypothetical protein C8Q74DRAFT_999101 [Fomes fomentarius]|nr:hypothetical protein C8Q74DRAFT_999101 [Fomes fomentarius]